MASKTKNTHKENPHELLHKIAQQKSENHGLRNDQAWSEFHPTKVKYTNVDYAAQQSKKTMVPGIQNRSTSQTSTKLAEERVLKDVTAHYTSQSNGVRQVNQNDVQEDMSGSNAPSSTASIFSTTKTGTANLSQDSAAVRMVKALTSSVPGTTSSRTTGPTSAMVQASKSRQVVLAQKRKIAGRPVTTANKSSKETTMIVPENSTESSTDPTSALSSSALISLGGTKESVDSKTTLKRSNSVFRASGHGAKASSCQQRQTAPQTNPSATSSPKTGDIPADVHTTMIDVASRSIAATLPAENYHGAKTDSPSVSRKEKRRRLKCVDRTSGAITDVPAADNTLEPLLNIPDSSSSSKSSPESERNDLHRRELAKSHDQIRQELFEREQEMFEEWRQQESNDLEEHQSLMSEYVVEIFEYLLQLEKDLMPNKTNMSKQPGGFDWTFRQRCVLMIGEICDIVLGQFPETNFLAVHILDRLFAKVPLSTIQQNNTINCLIWTTLFIASKYEGRNWSTSGTNFELLAQGLFTSADLFSLERQVLERLEYRLEWPGPLSFMRRCSRGGGSIPETRAVAKFLLEIIIADEIWLDHMPSKLAAACMYLGEMTVTEKTWDLKMVYFSGYYEEELRDLCLDIVQVLKLQRSFNPRLLKKYGWPAEKICDWVRKNDLV